MCWTKTARDSGCWLALAHHVKEPCFRDNNFGDPDCTAVKPCPDHLATLSNGESDQTGFQCTPTSLSGSPPHSLQCPGGK